MSEYDCVGVTSEYLDSLKNKIAELEQQNKELKEALLKTQNECCSNCRAAFEILDGECNGCDIYKHNLKYK